MNKIEAYNRQRLYYQATSITHQRMVYAHALLALTLYMSTAFVLDRNAQQVQHGV